MTAHWFWVSLTVILASALPYSQGDASSESVLLEFNVRDIVVKDLEEKFQRFISSPPSDETLRDALQKEFLQSYQTDFKKTDEWIFAAMVTNNAEESLLHAELARNENHGPATKTFFKRVMNTFNAAILMHKRANLLLSKNLTQVLELEQKGKTSFKIVADEAQGYLTQVAWKTQYRTDVKNCIAKWQFSGNVEANLIAFLKQKYPFRSWLVVSRAQTTKQWVTSPLKDVENLEIPAHGGKMVLVLSVRQERYFNPRSASFHLNNVMTESSHMLCRSRAQDIFKEMKINCDTTSHAFAATVGFTDDRSLPVVSASDPNMMKTKRSLSNWWVFCRRYYLSVIFA